MYTDRFACGVRGFVGIFLGCRKIQRGHITNTNRNQKRQKGYIS